MATQEQIEKIAAKIAQEYKPEKIILFGSYAWGKPTEDSDVDLFIIEKTEEPKRMRQIKLRKWLFGSGLPMDLIVYTPEEVRERLKIKDFFIEEIINKGKVIYERS